VKQAVLSALALVLACCNANDVLLYGPAAAGAGDVNGDGAVGNMGSTATGGSNATGGSGGTHATGGTDATGGTSAAGSNAGGTGDVAGGGGTTALTSCSSDADCESAAWYCSRLSCDDAAGVCLPVPIECDAVFDPVCGCDNITYFNTCVLESYGESARHPRDCSDMNVHAPCMNDDECGDGRTCVHLFPRPDEMNCSYHFGTCWGIPSDCDGSDMDPRKWVPCGPPAMGNPGCVSTCVALQSRGAYVPAPPNACP
jgi:hypothetical protein